MYFVEVLSQAPIVTIILKNFISYVFHILLYTYVHMFYKMYETFHACA